MDSTTYISAREAGNRLGVSAGCLPKIAEANGIRIRDIPPMKTRYNAQDVDQLVTSMVKLGGRSRQARAVG